MSASADPAEPTRKTLEVARSLPGRIARTAVHLPLLTSAVARMIVEDPAHFAVQTSRRLPRRLRDALGSGPAPRREGSTPRALWLMMVDRPGIAKEELSASMTRGPLADAIRVQVGAPLDESASARNRAKELWEAGDIDEAIGLAPAPLRRVFEARTRVLTPGRTLTLPLMCPDIHPRSRIRVLHALTNSLPWTNSGYALRSHAVLIAQRDVGLDVLAVTRLAYPITIGRPWTPTRDVINGIDYRRLLPRALPRYEDDRLAVHAKMLVEEARAFAPHVLHTTTNFHNALVTRAVAQALDIPWVYEFRGELEKSWVARRPHDQEERALASQRYAMMRARETEMALAADAVVALSHHQARSLVERGIPENTISVIPNAVDETLLDTPRDREAARTALGLRPDKPWVGTVSAIVDYEGLDTLIDALAEVRGRGMDVGCLIVGDGVSRESLIQQARERGLHVAVGLSDPDADVVFPGKVSPDEALTWYQALDIMTIPRRDTPVTRAVTPIKGLQAMALGIPQIVSDLPALVEVGARDGQGIAIAPGDSHALAGAITRVLADSDLAERLADAGRCAAAERTWAANGRAYERLYRSLLD